MNETEEVKTLIDKEAREIKMLIHGMNERAKQSSLVTSGMAVVSLAVGFTGVAIALQDVRLLEWAKWLLGIASVYVVVIFVCVIRRWLALKIKAK